MGSKKWVMNHITLDAGYPFPSADDYEGGWDSPEWNKAYEKHKEDMKIARSEAYRLGIGEWWSDYAGVKYTTPKDPKYKNTIFILPQIGYKGKIVLIGNRSEYPPRNIDWTYHNSGDEVGYGGYSQKKFSDKNYIPFRYGIYFNAKSAKEAVSAYLDFMESSNTQPLPSTTLHKNEIPREEEKGWRSSRFDWVSEKEQYDILKQNGWKDGERIWKRKDKEGNTTYSVMKQDWDEYQSTLPMTLEQQRKIAHLYTRINYYGGLGVVNMEDKRMHFEREEEAISHMS